jgi:hypothetical protein
VSASARLAAFAAGLVLAGCALAPDTLGPGPVGDERLRFELQTRWSPIRQGLDPEVNADQLTQNGPLLDRLFVASLESGDGLLTPGFEAHPRWWAGTPADALDGFLAGSLAALGYENIQVVAKTEHAFAGEPGVLYSLALERPGGLEISGQALAGAQGETLDLLLFLAPREHYFARRRSEVSHIFDTLERRAPPP